MSLEELPREVLEDTLKLPGHLQKIYLTLYNYGKPADASTVAEQVGQARAHISMRLNQLEVMGYVTRSKKGKRVTFEVIK